MKTKKYYDSNPEAKEKKKAYDTKYHSSEERKKYRAFLNKYGNGDGLDYDHDEKRFMKATKNRAKK
jgi:predicted DsbA family dithiol-disulfide isomerase